MFEGFPHRVEFVPHEAAPAFELFDDPLRRAVPNVDGLSAVFPPVHAPFDPFAADDVGSDAVRAEDRGGTFPPPRRYLRSASLRNHAA